MLDCDWCENPFLLETLFNVDYLDETGEPNGYSNVLCPACVKVSAEIHSNRLDAWQ